MTYSQEIIDIFKANPDAVLSGSWALVAQDIKIRREPDDIDIYLPIGVEFKTLPEMKFKEDDEAYDEEESQRQDFTYNFVKVNVFKHANTEEAHRVFDTYNSIKVLHWTDILKYKHQHARFESSTHEKHQRDLIHILVNN